MTSRTPLSLLLVLLAAGVTWPLQGCGGGSRGDEEDADIGDEDAGDAATPEDADANGDDAGTEDSGKPADAGGDARVDAGSDASPMDATAEAGDDAALDASADGTTPEAGLDANADASDATADADATPPDATPDAPACPGCANDRCLPDGTCIECSAELPCIDTALKCDTATHTCVACLPSDDTCPDGSYCTVGHTCAQGCKNDAACASGSCDANHECERCLEDDECGTDRVCGTFECGTSCGGAGDATCATGSECCSGQCVDTERDIQHCGGCGVACGATQFCGRSGCSQVELGKLCESTKLVVVKSGLGGDALESELLGTSLASDCSPAVQVTSVVQSETELLNPTTGQPLAGGNYTLVTLGSGYANKLVSYVESHAIAPLSMVLDTSGTPWEWEFQKRGTNDVVFHGVVDDETSTHAHFVLQVARDPASGSLIVLAYGFWAEGTVAARWFLANQVLPALGTYTKTWYIYDWQDGGTAGVDAADSFTLVDSGD